VTERRLTDQRVRVGRRLQSRDEQDDQDLEVLRIGPERSLGRGPGEELPEGGNPHRVPVLGGTRAFSGEAGSRSNADFLLQQLRQRVRQVDHRLQRRHAFLVDVLQFVLGGEVERQGTHGDPGRAADTGQRSAHVAVLVEFRRGRGNEGTPRQLSPVLPSHRWEATRETVPRGRRTRNS
jgi:hypothetical protein